MDLPAGTFGFDRPEWLWLLLAWVPLLALAIWTRRNLSRRRRAVALAVRTGLLLAVVLALAEVGWRRPVDDLAVVFVVDRSASVGPAAEAQALRFVQDALGGQAANDRAGVVVFGADALVEAEPRAELAVHGLESAPSPHQSDIAAGLRLGTALLPGDRTRRVVLLTDGEETRGDAAAQAILAASEDLRIGVVALGGASRTDALIEDVVVPGRVDHGAPYEVRVVARTDATTTGTLRLYRNDALLGELPVALEAGRSRVLTFRQPGGAAGLYRYRAELAVDAAVDALPQNNRGVATVQVAGQPRVLYADGDPALAGPLRAVLEGAGITVDVVAPERIPSGLEGLRAYDAVILSDVPSWAVGRRQQEALRSYVRDLGRGLVMIGGEFSFGVGGWYRSPVEEALPVRMDIEDKSRFPKLAMVLAIDKSCSMGSGPGSKLALAREAAIQTAELLSDRDMLGVIGFDGAASWISPLQELTGRQAIVDDIAALRSGGGTDIYPALRTAYHALDGSDAGQKHVILMSDGVSQGGDFETLIRGAHAREVTLTAIGIGSDADQRLMTDFARWGGGSYYFVADPDGIPAVFTRETLLASRSFLVEEPFVPELGAPSELVQGVGVLPTLHGHVATEPKERSTVALWVPHDEAPTPLLAHWRFGLGRAVAFTSDAKARWGSEWVGSESYVRLWTQVIRWVAGGADDALQVEAEIRDSELHVVVDAFDARGAFRNFLDGHARIVAPDLTVHELPLRQVGPGRYEARAPVDQDGSWLAAVVLRDGEVTVGQGLDEAVQAYSPEYRARGAGGPLAAEIGRVGGGGLLTDPSEVFRRPEVPRQVPRPLWHPLIALAACLLVLDVAVRRLDLRRSRAPIVSAEGFGGRPAPRPAPGAPPVAPAPPVDAPPPVDPGSYAGRLLAARREARKKLDDRR